MDNRYIKGSDFIEHVCAAIGIDASRVSRLIIEANFDDAVQVHVTHIGSNKLLNVEWNNVVTKSQEIKGRLISDE